MSKNKVMKPDRDRARAELSRTAPADSITSRISESDVIAYRDDRGRPCDYVPSGRTYVTYDGLSAPSYGYYTHWRDCVRNGTFPETDIGYVILLASEIVTFSDAPHRDIRILADLVRRYHHLNRRLIGFVGDACVTMSIMKRTEIPPILLMNDIDLMRYQIYRALGEGSVGYVPINSVIAVADLDCPVQTDGRMDAVFNIALSRVDRKIRKLLSIGLRDMLGELSDISIPVYNGLSYGGWRKRVSIEIPIGFTNSIGGKMIIDIAKMILGGRYNSIDMPERGNDMIRATVMECISEYDMGRSPSETISGFSLDRDGISRSEEDLKAVTEMMRIPEGTSVRDDPSVGAEVADTMPAQKDVSDDTGDDPSDDGDGWGVLAETLSEIMHDYLMAAMNDEAEAYLSDVGYRMTTLEKEINKHAMDLLQDIIVEDGRIIPEYIDDISEMLGCRRYRSAHS